jgi:ERF superfamily
MTNKPETEIVAQTNDITPVAQQSVDSFISLAISQNAPIETLERLFALHKEVEAEKAKSAYIKALSMFQRMCPVIEKKKKVMNKDGVSVRYMFAPLDDIVSQIKEHLGKNDLSYTWTVLFDENGVTAIAKITHVQGHSETSSFTVPIGKDGFMTAPQQNAAAQTFAKRYALCNALGISTGDEDTDATTVNTEKKPKSDKSKIMFCLKALGKNPEGLEKEAVTEMIKELTQLDPIEKNLSEIVTRLEVMVTEKNEYDNSQVQ